MKSFKFFNIGLLAHIITLPVLLSENRSPIVLILTLCVQLAAFYQYSIGARFGNARTDYGKGAGLFRVLTVVGSLLAIILFLFAAAFEGEFATGFWGIFVPLMLLTTLWTGRFGRFSRKYRYKRLKWTFPTLVTLGILGFSVFYFFQTYTYDLYYYPIFLDSPLTFLLLCGESILIGLSLSFLRKQHKLWLPERQKPTGKLNQLRSRSRTHHMKKMHAEKNVEKNAVPGNYQYLKLMEARDAEMPTLYYHISTKSAAEFWDLRAAMDDARKIILINEPTLRKSWPHIFCTHCNIRPQIQQISMGLKTPVCPKCNSGKWLEPNVREVVGVFGENTQWRHVGDQLFVGLWDEAKKQAYPAQVDTLSIEGGASPAKDWAVNSWLQAMDTFKYAGKKPALLPREAQQKLSENTLRMAKAHNAIAFDGNPEKA